MRTVLKREIRKATTQSQLENVVGLVMPRMVWERIVGDTVVMPGKEENMAFAMCVFETS